ncbi:MAG: thiamine pyrophosphate-binding protein [Pseudomonadota bacterium]|nr:thiamine pyrophosphate-binding protein [Pseudomonadota bacterium]
MDTVDLKVTEMTAADRMIDALDELGVRHFLGNGGTDFPALVRAFSKRQDRVGGGISPKAIVHENVAVAMAHGCWLAGGGLCAVMVHVTVGTANALCGIMNAQRDRVPLLMMAGRTPLTETGSDASRNVFIHWGQESFDQGGSLREYVKWDYEPRVPEQVVPSVCRGVSIATSEPHGPVYLSLAREHLHAAAPALPVETPVLAAATAAPATLDALADRIAAAERPLLITSAAGRHPDGFDAVTAFAERWSVPVVQFRPRSISMPASSPWHAGYDPHEAIKTADLILLTDVDVPWIPSRNGASGTAHIVALGSDPLQQSYPVWGFAPDTAIDAPGTQVLAALADRPGDAPQRGNWAARAGQATDSTGFDFARASAVLAEEMPEALFVNENPLDPSQLGIETQGRYYSSSPAGGLGWGLGAALGVKMARPEADVVCTVGDGAYMFGVPTAFHHAARRYDLPVLTVVFNNAKWGGVQRSTEASFPDETLTDLASAPFIDLGESPEFGMICASCGGLGLKARTEVEFRAALTEARAAIRNGRQALIDLRFE